MCFVSYFCVLCFSAVLPQLCVRGGDSVGQPRPRLVLPPHLGRKVVGSPLCGNHGWRARTWSSPRRRSGWSGTCLGLETCGELGCSWLAFFSIGFGFPFLSVHPLLRGRSGKVTERGLVVGRGIHTPLQRWRALSPQSKLNSE